MLLSPILATEGTSCTQLYDDRSREGEKKVTELQQENTVTLHGKKDIVASAKEEIHEKRSRLPAPQTFREELEALLKLLPHPEELLSINQRRMLIGFPLLEPIQPIINTIEFLGNFIKKWQSLTAHAEALQLAANQTIWYHGEWAGLVIEMWPKLTNKTMLCKDLLKLYEWVSCFHAEGIHLTTSYEDLKSTLQQSTAILPEGLDYLDSLFYELTGFLHVRGSILWEIIRYSNLVITAEEARNLAENYDDLPSEFFLDNSNFIKKILQETDAYQKITILSPIRHDYSPLKIRPSCSSSPMLRANPSSLRVQKSSLPSTSQQVHSAPQTRSSSPIPLRTKEKIPTTSLEGRLQEAFVQPVQWGENVTAFKEKILLLIHAKFIVDPLCNLLNYYDHFKISYLRHHGIAYDILSPKALVDIPGQPLVRIPQTLGRQVCSLKSNGHLCFNLPECDFETTLTFSGYIGNLIFKKRRELYPSETRNQILQFYFESLFGISSDPVLVCACSNVSFYAPKDSRQKPNPNFCFENYITKPSAWGIQQNLDFITIHKKHKGSLFSALLTQIADGQGFFKEQLDPSSIGRWTLFGFLTQEYASPENFELVQSGRKLSPKRVGAQAFLQPLFMLREDKNHHFIGHNFFYLLPFMDEEIPQDVKMNFMSNNIFLYLATVLTQLTKTQRDFDEFIQKYKLTEDDELKHDLDIEAKLSKADVLGLTLTAREETISELLRNFTIIKQQLTISGITYRQILRVLRPLESNCYEKILENARRKTQETPIFFKNVMPSIIQKLRNVHEKMVELGEIPLYTMEELDLVEQASVLYHKKIAEYLEAINDLNDKRVMANLRKENIERTQTDSERKISGLREKLSSVESTEKKDAEVSLDQPKITKIVETSEKIDIIISIQEAGSNSHVLVEEDTKSELQRLLEEEIKKKHENTRKLASILEELEKIDLSLKDLHMQLSPEFLFKKFQHQVSPDAQTFLKNKYKWAEENHIFHASVVLKAWESMFDAEKPLIYENLINPKSSPDWSQVPMLTQNQLAPIYAQLVESNHPIECMVQDLIAHADISSFPLDMALELLDRLLTLNPCPQKYHESWREFPNKARKLFLGMPPHVRSFLHSLGLQPDEEKRVLQNAHLEKFANYQGPVKIAMGSLEQDTTPEQFASRLFHQLWAESLELDQEKDRLFFDGLLKLFSLPLCGSQMCGSQISAGFAASPESKGGIFDLRYRVGDHYLLIDSPEWIKLFNSCDILPTNTRLALLSQPPHLLLLQWLDVLKQKVPGISFHAWYPKTVISKIVLLQEFLQTRLSFTFNEIMSVVWPELHFITRQKLNSHDNDVDLTLRSQAGEMGKLTPVEHKGVNLDNRKDGKNMLALLRKREEEHMRCTATSPLSLDDAATEWIAHVNPAEYGPEVLAHILDLATHFIIDPTKINSTLWGKPEILTDLVSVKAPMECLQLATALHVGLPFKEISLSLKQRSSSYDYRISGLKGNVALICELIRLFPGVTSLSLAHNELRSLKPLVSSLQTLSSLTDLDLKNNPIHNPAPLAEFPQLTHLNIENTGIPDIYPKVLKELIAREKRVKVETVKLLETIKFFSSGPKGTTEIRECKLLREKSPPELLKLIQGYMGFPILSLEDTDKMICILELLAEGEGLWLDTLVLERDKLNLPCDVLFNMLQEFDPREAAYKLLFAIKYHLPHGTNRDTLYFLNHKPSINADCLSRLDVSGVDVDSQFLKSLNQFENLFHLALVDTTLAGSKSCILDILPKLPQLRILNLKKNHIKTLKGLHTTTQDCKFPELNVFILVNNEIVTDRWISLLVELGKLTYLDLSNNLLDQMPSLGNLRGSLKYLNLTENKIPLNQLIDYKDTDNFKFIPQKKRNYSTRPKIEV
jgi:Leucine-rich repeat (LRR) protein